VQLTAVQLTAVQLTAVQLTAVQLGAPLADPAVADVLARDLNRASVMVDLGRYGDAASLLGCVLASSPGSSRGWCLLSRAHLGSGNAPEAAAAAARASALDPADDWPYRLVSTALLAMGQPAEAVSAAQEARQLAPHFWRSHVCLAQAATAEGEHKLAAQAAAAALALAPDVADVHVTAGKAALARGELVEARRWQESALGIEPTHSGAINELGRISLRSRDAATAVGHFLHAARTSPGTGVFSRNTELAIGRVALRLTVRATAIALVTACVIAAAVAGNLPLAILFGLLVVPLAMRTVRDIRRLPAEGRRHLIRLLRARWARAGHRARTAATRGMAALARGRTTSSNPQAGNEAPGG
jgi:predicted Zn-dependent protease